MTLPRKPVRPAPHYEPESEREIPIVSYYDSLEHRRRVEHWPTYEQARERYYVLVNTAFAAMVRLGSAELVEPRSAPVHREEGKEGG